MTQEIKLLKTATQNIVNYLNPLIDQLGPKYPSQLTVEKLQEIIDRPDNYIFIAYDDKKIIGVVALSSLHVLTGKKLWVEDMVVDEKYRGQGIGFNLIEAVKKYAKENGFTHINLTSRPAREAANQLYRKAGFEINETNYYRYTIK